mgnify:CR=1 FL=1
MCRHEQTAKRVLKARHGRGCKRAKAAKCACGGCARVALLLRAADTLGECGAGPSRWLRVLDYTEGAAAGRLPVRRFGVTGEEGEGNHQFTVADVDRDGLDEIVFGALTIDHDGISYGKIMHGYYVLHSQAPANQISDRRALNGRALSSTS